MAKEINVAGRMKVKTLKKDFNEVFNAGIRVYNGKKFANDDATLASIRSDDAKGGGIKIHGRTKVSNVEKMFKEQMGITIQIENRDGGFG